LKSLRHLFPFKSYFHFRFPLPFRGRHLRFWCRPMSGCFGSVISKSGMVENMGVAVEIASPYVSVQMLFPLPVPWQTLCLPDIGLCRTMSAVSYSSRALSKIWPIAYRLASLCLSIQKLCVHACFSSAILKFACRSTCHVTNFTHLWVFSSPVLSGQLL